ARKVALPPFATISAVTASSSWARRATRTNRAPSRAKSTAAALPMPLLAPAIIIVLLSSSISDLPVRVIYRGGQSTNARVSRPPVLCTGIHPVVLETGTASAGTCTIAGSHAAIFGLIEENVAVIKDRSVKVMGNAEERQKDYELRNMMT